MKQFLFHGPAELHKRLKQYAATSERKIKDVLYCAVVEYLDRNEKVNHEVK